MKKIKIKLILVLVALIFILVAANLIKYFYNEKNTVESVDQIEFENKTDFSLQYGYQGELPKLSNNERIYSFGENKVSREKADQIANSLDFYQEAETVNSIDGEIYKYFSADKKKSLLIYSYSAKAEYYDSNEENDEQVSQEDLVKIGQKFGQKFLKNYDNLKLSEPKINWVKSEDYNYVKTDNIAEATHLELKLGLEIDEKQILANNFSNEAITLLISRSGLVKKASIVIVPDDLVSKGRVNLTKTSEALYALNSGLGTVIRINDPYSLYEAIEPSKIAKVELSSVETVYVFDKEKKQAQPFYRFLGKAETSDGGNLEVAVVIIAIPQENLK